MLDFDPTALNERAPHPGLRVDALGTDPLADPSGSSAALRPLLEGSLALAKAKWKRRRV